MWLFVELSTAVGGLLGNSSYEAVGSVWVLAVRYMKQEVRRSCGSTVQVGQVRRTQVPDSTACIAAAQQGPEW